VDDEDYEWLNQWKWYAHKVGKIKKKYYAVRKSHDKVKENDGRKLIGMHRIIMNPPKNRVVDHINHNSLDNRRSNLRIVTNRQNMQNLENKGSSKYPGVSWYSPKNKWRASIHLKDGWKHIGYFLNERDAAKAYESFCRKNGEELVCKLNRTSVRQK
jgi:hypothetical protein